MELSDWSNTQKSSKFDQKINFPTFFAIFSVPESSEPYMTSFVAMGNGELGLLATYLQRSIAAILDVRFSEIVSSVCLSFSRPSAQIILHKVEYLLKAENFFQFEIFSRVI